MKNESLLAVDWSIIPEPKDDGSADHLEGAFVPSVKLRSAESGTVNPGNLAGWSVLYFYPMTGDPDISLPGGQIPGKGLHTTILRVSGPELRTRRLRGKQSLWDLDLAIK